MSTGLSGFYRQSMSGRYNNLRELMIAGRIGATRNLSTMSNFERFPFKVKNIEFSLKCFNRDIILFSNLGIFIIIEEVVYGETHSRVV